MLTLTPVTLTHWRVVEGTGQQGNRYITTISNKFWLSTNNWKGIVMFKHKRTEHNTADVVGTVVQILGHKSRRHVATPSAASVYLPSPVYNPPVFGLVSAQQQYFCRGWKSLHLKNSLELCSPLKPLYGLVYCVRINSSRTITFHWDPHAGTRKSTVTAQPSVTKTSSTLEHQIRSALEDD